MTASYLTIESRHRQDAGFLSSLADFSYAEGDAVGAEIVRDSPNISLYCLDDQAKRAIFVELPPKADLSMAPFIYQTQYEHAQRLVAVPYEAFTLLGRQLPKIERLIMIYMTGRSGSTLLNNIFNEVDGVLSLSEPDVATQFVHLRGADGRSDAEAGELLDCTLRFLFKPGAHKAASIYALKPRSEVLQVMDLFQATFPQAKNLFLYRDAVGWVASFYRIFTREWAPEPAPFDKWCKVFELMFNRDFTHLAAYLDAGIKEISTVQQLTLWWLAIMEWYLEQHQRGIEILALRYDDLNIQRENVVAEIFSYCGLPDASVQKALGAFTRDSQAGTFLAREKASEGNRLRLSDAQIGELAAILARHPIVKDSAFVAPGTLGV